LGHQWQPHQRWQQDAPLQPGESTYHDYRHRLTWNAFYNGEGARLRQITNDVATSYTFDPAAPLVTVLAQQDAGGKKRYLCDQGDSHWQSIPASEPISPGGTGRTACVKSLRFDI